MGMSTDGAAAVKLEEDMAAQGFLAAQEMCVEERL